MLQFGCTDSNTDKPVDTIDSVMSDTLRNEIKADTIIIKKSESGVFKLSVSDKQILDLMYSIDIGFNFNKTKEKYPSLKGIRPEENRDALASAGLTESVCKQPLFGGEAIAEFNYRNDSLYSYNFTYPELNSEKAEQVFEEIKKYYSVKWGEALQERVEEDNRFSQIFLWPNVKSVVPYINYNLNTNTITWGKRIERNL